MAAAMGHPTGAAALIEWVEAHFGGRVVRVERLPRWRVGWFLDVVVGHDAGASTDPATTLELYARGARGPDFPSPYDLEHERRVHDLLEDHGFPVPHVHGIIEVDAMPVMVMDRVRGVQGLQAEPDEATRRRLMLECVDLMARMHRIGLDELRARGFEVPASPGETVWSGAIARLEEHYLASVHPRDPVIDFLRGWLRRNTPAGRDRPAFVTWDAAQFLHADGRLTALIDFELAHVGDPYMDLAPLRSRDTMELFGDLSGAFARYEAAVGEPVDLDVVRYFEIAQLTATLMLQRPVLLAPDAGSDLVTHIVWYVESARYALDVLAELLGEPLETIAPVDVAPRENAVAHAHLVRSLHAATRPRAGVDPRDPGEVMRRWQARCDYRLARHLARVDEAGAAITRAELADAAEVVGRVVRDRADADDALVALVAREDPALERTLLHYCNRRMQRASALLGPPDAQLVQHVPLQPLPDAVPGNGGGTARR